MIGRGFRLGVVAAGLLAMGTSAWAMESPETFMKAVDTDADKTISTKEVEAYAMGRFDEINEKTPKDETLTMAELGDRMTPTEFKAANTEHRGNSPSLSRAEFKAYIEKLFAEANTQVKSGSTAADGTLSVEELSTPAGQKLIKLLK